MHRSVLHAPVKDPKKIVDIACGTGVVTRDLAAKFPAAQVYGVDLIAMPEEQSVRPSNLEYIEGDIMKLTGEQGDTRLAPGSLDYVFQRLLVCGMKCMDWPEYVKTAAKSVRSGGWVEIHEWDFQVSENGVNVSDEWPWQQEMIRRGRETKGLDLRCAQKVAGWMRDAGLVDVKTVSYFAPLGTWDVDARPETRTMAEYLTKWWPTVNRVLIPSLVGTEDKQHVEDLMVQMLKTLKTAEEEQRKAYEIVVCYGRKP
jgi:trans-aconitate methyltransferase